MAVKALGKGRRRTSTFIADDPHWYRDAIIYEIHVRAFADSNGDGMGDFPGLTQKLDYLQDLGVTALWLLPFYPSPWRDDGYDTSDFCAVHPSYGTLRDFQVFLREAHRRGLRVITELVLNHTSDQHAWFQRARRARPGSRHRDYYVWSDTPDRYADARIIFKDFESSNWAWDPIARAYYWHRFYSHQPDLNFDSPDVRRAMLDVMRFWMDMGVDGMRLDAVPYLYEREGTSCENLLETHEFLQFLRREVDVRFSNRMLLAEANQWPEDAVAYFGDGNECHMAFHFPLMPRLFMGIHMEERHPIIEILENTPPIPETAQWALFLRNHDELTLEMVTDAERDYMYRMYARETHARINLGIRRRLAPLLGNNRRKIELMQSLLLSLPGTPVLYYGDEIGMGDNIYLGDRNGVRTPMQWTGDRNAGFSTCNTQRLYLPVIADPEYRFEAINVESQQNNLHSLLWWNKRLLALRKQYKVFGRGSIEFIQPDNRKILAFVRQYEGEAVLIVANLSRFVQFVHLNLSQFAERVPVELFGGTRFPPIQQDPYWLTLGPHSFFWFSLEAALPAEAIEIQSPQVPQFSCADGPDEIFLAERRSALTRALLQHVRAARWFGNKTRRIRDAGIEDVIPIECGQTAAKLFLLRVEYIDGDPDIYCICVSVAANETAYRVREKAPQAVIAESRTNGDAPDCVVFDALRDESFTAALIEHVARRRQMRGERGRLVTNRTRAFRDLFGGSDGEFTSAVSRAEQSNTSIIYQEPGGASRFILKLFRRLEPGTNPDLEIGRFLTETRRFQQIAPVAGALEYTTPGQEPVTIGILQGYVKNDGDAWRFTLDTVAHYFERVLEHAAAEQAPPEPAGNGNSNSNAASETLNSEKVREWIGSYLDCVHLLGRRTAELHMALASNQTDPAFAPEPFTEFHRQSLYHGMLGPIKKTFRLLRERMRSLPAPLREAAGELVEMEPLALARLRPLRDRKIGGMRIRVHGDYHLGQVLFTGEDFVIIDFEGEPSASLGERRVKRSPLRDIAGMLRSFEYAPQAVMLGQASGVVFRQEDEPRLQAAAEAWYDVISAAFLDSYRRTVEPAGILPSSQQDFEAVLEACLLEKAAYELNYELNSRPDWVAIPIRGLLRLLRRQNG